MKPFYENRSNNSKHLVQAFVHENFSFLAHWHSDVELVYVLEGNIKVGINQDVRILKKGDLGICCSDDIHFYDSGNMYSKIIVVIFKPHAIGFPSGWPLDKRFASPFIERETIEKVQKADILDTIEKVCFSFLQEINRSDSASNYFITARLYELCGLLLRNFDTINYKSHTDQYSKNFDDISIMHNILNYIDSNYTSEVSLSDISKKFNLSTSYLSKLFVKTIGMNFTSYIASKRILKAEYLLKSADIPVSEIAYECGFESIRTFNRVFKAINGIPPSHFRKNIVNR